MATTLIVARLKQPGSEAAISRLFAESDGTELPDLVGVRERRLLTFRDLYFHLVQSDEPLARRLTPQHDHPLFQSISQAMDQYVTPYDGAWGSVQEASARQFYHWQRDAGVRQP
ncbi:TcmI family type II polyketide cyclase [Streptomyces sp. B1866]|uniref:TcmI family type II polyketide cyclase n=1 Tax=Streptomyces sp. B1866 TaxID=3075431 RepID=UPI00288E60BB|nr:TcmI family type II polyketide cyclase [Streptomyces sp. B1866]MDT3397875.1 TcmI family type II polyketide cyclase [Streptomyces sp. B1866]